MGELLSVVIGMIVSAFVIAMITGSDLEEHREWQALIIQCESSIPRNETCVLVAVRADKALK